MALTDTQIRKIKPKDKPYKVSDGGGLYVLHRNVWLRFVKANMASTGYETDHRGGPAEAIRTSSLHQKFIRMGSSSETERMSWKTGFSEAIWSVADPHSRGQNADLRSAGHLTHFRL